MMMGVRTEEHCLGSQVGIGSESDCLLGQLCKILEISDSETDLKVEKVGGVVGGGLSVGTPRRRQLCSGSSSIDNVVCRDAQHAIQHVHETAKYDQNTRLSIDLKLISYTLFVWSEYRQK